MRTVRIDINDNVYDKVMFFLTNLPKSEVRSNIENEKKQNDADILKVISLKTKGFKFDREEANER